MDKRVSELDRLFTEVGTYSSSAQLKELYDFIRRFPRIAPYNAMLLHVQKPGSSYVATAREWRRTFGREIKAGATPLVILRPFGPVAFVFELGDTQGDDPFPEELSDPFRVKGDVPQRVMKRLISNLTCDGIAYKEVDHGTGSAGFIQTSKGEQVKSLIRGSKELEIRILYDMVINRRLLVGAKFATILHELGHLYCGHLGSPNPKWWTSRLHLPRDVQEFETESVCWLVCERLGISNPSAEYLSGYLGEHKSVPKISIDAVLKTTGVVESMLAAPKLPRKELRMSEITRAINRHA